MSKCPISPYPGGCRPPPGQRIFPSNRSAVGAQPSTEATAGRLPAPTRLGKLPIFLDTLSGQVARTETSLMKIHQAMASSAASRRPFFQTASFRSSPLAAALPGGWGDTFRCSVRAPAHLRKDPLISLRDHSPTRMTMHSADPRVGNDATPLPSLSVAGLRCEGLREAQQVDTPAPRFSWRIVVPPEQDRGVRQTACQLRVVEVDSQGRPLGSALREGLAAHLVRTVAEKDNHLATGFLGTPLLAPVLTSIGRADLAYTVLQQTTYPGWLFSIVNGATTAWERWDSSRPEGGFHKDGMNSFNHHVCGTVVSWFYDTIAGLQPLPEAPGWKYFRIAPLPGGGLTHASARVQTPYGEAASSWRIEDGRFRLAVRTPPNTDADVVL